MHGFFQNSFQIFFSFLFKQRINYFLSEYVGRNVSRGYLADIGAIEKLYMLLLFPLHSPSSFFPLSPVFMNT
jgi:hypothetical protein